MVAYPISMDMIYLHIPSLMWSHSAVWQVSILSQVCCIDESFPNPRVSPFDVESVNANSVLVEKLSR